MEELHLHMSFCIKRQALSLDCRREIMRGLREKGIECNQHAFLDAVDRLLAGFKRYGQRKKLDVKRVRQDLRALSKTLNSLNPGAKRLLSSMYSQAYPLPPSSGEFVPGKVNECLILRVMNQSKNSHFIRNDARGKLGLPVPLDELIARLLRTCELVEKHYHPPKGAPIDNERVLFTMYIIDTFECFTRIKATATPNAAFDKFLGAIFADITGEKRGISRRKMITAAIAERARLSPVDAEYVQLCEMVSKGNKKAEAKRRLNTMIPPARAASLENLLSFLGDSSKSCGTK